MHDVLSASNIMQVLNRSSVVDNTTMHNNHCYIMMLLTMEAHKSKLCTGRRIETTSDALVVKYSLELSINATLRYATHSLYYPTKSSSKDVVASNSLRRAQFRSSKSLTRFDAASRSARANRRFRDASSTSRRMYPSSCSSCDASRPPRGASSSLLWHRDALLHGEKGRHDQ